MLRELNQSTCSYNFVFKNHQYLRSVGISLRLQGKLGFPYNVKKVSRFMGSRSHPHRVLSVCVCVCVSRCLWVCVIEADSLQLRVITVGLYLFLSRSPLSDPCSVCGRRLRSVLVPRFLSPAASWTPIAGPWLPIASLRYPPQPYGKLRICLRKAPFLPTEAPPLPYGKLRFCLRKLRLCLRKAPLLPTEAPPLPYGKLRLVSRCVLLL